VWYEKEKAMPRKIRPIRIEGDVAYIPLTKGYEAIIDAEDVPLVDKYNWQVSQHKKVSYAVMSKKVEGGKWKTKYLHRAILQPTKEFEVDHINGNGLDNRKTNLRLATSSQNRWNTRKQTNNTSGFKGVYYHKRSKKWRAQIKLSRKKFHLGHFNTPEEAYAAYCVANERLHGEFGRVE
jgi:hypothetical protein